MPGLFPTIASFESAFRSHYQKLVAYAYKQTHDVAVSEDIVQELFVDMYEKREKIEIHGSISSYLFQATFNRCKSLQRKQLTIRKYEATIRHEDLQEFRDLLTETEFEHKVFKAINKLPSKCREIFMLNRFEDLSNDEIASRLGISKRTVETQISKALKKLRSSLDPQSFYILFM